MNCRERCCKISPCQHTAYCVKRLTNCPNCCANNLLNTSTPPPPKKNTLWHWAAKDDGTFIFSDGAENLIGYTDIEMIGMNGIETLMAKDCRESIKPIYKTNKKYCLNHPSKLHHKNGHIIHCITYRVRHFHPLNKKHPALITGITQRMT